MTVASDDVELVAGILLLEVDPPFPEAVVGAFDDVDVVEPVDPGLALTRHVRARANSLLVTVTVVVPAGYLAEQKL